MSRKISTRFFLKLCNANITNIAIQHLAAHAAHTNRVTHNLDGEWLRLSLTNNRQGDRRFHGAAHHLDRIIQRQALRGRVIDF